MEATTTTRPTVHTDAALRCKAAREEHALLAAWHASGSIGERPVTVNLDSLHHHHESGTRTMKKTTKSTTPRAPRVKVQYYRNGRALGPSFNTMAHLALQSTKGVPGPGEKLNSAGLTALLAEAGITDPTSTSWTFTLPTGVTIGAVAPGDDVPDALTVSVRRSRPADAPVADVYAIVRTGERAYQATKNGKTLGSVMRSAAQVRNALRSAFGVHVEDVTDMRAAS